MHDPQYKIILTFPDVQLSSLLDFRLSGFLPLRLSGLLLSVLLPYQL